MVTIEHNVTVTESANQGPGTKKLRGVRRGVRRIKRPDSTLTRKVRHEKLRNSDEVFHPGLAACDER